MYPMKRVYIETTIVSYLAAFPSGNIVAAAHQHITHEWWKLRSEYELCTSALVHKEAGQGDSSAAARRLDILRGMHVLEVNEETDTVALAIMASGLLPAKAVYDAQHMAIATVHGVHYVVTWNFRHIANPEIMYALGRIVAQKGYELPVLCTPEILLGEKLK